MTRSKKVKGAKYYEAKRAKNVRARETKRMKQQSLISVPQISEDDLLSFQVSHFGDDSTPTYWFVDAETAIHFQPQYEEDDDLGYYPDGVKRTLTDAQIEIFRNSELWRLEREKLRRHEEEHEPSIRIQSPRVASTEEVSESALANDVQASIADNAGARGENSANMLLPRSNSPGEGLRPPRDISHTSMQRHGQREDHHSTTEHSRAKGHKRHWDKFVEVIDETHGAMTHRRIARELDIQVSNDVELDY